MFAFKLAFSVLSFPFSGSVIDKKASSMHQVVFPLSLVDGPIGKFIHTLSTLLVVFPRSPVDGSIGVVIGSLSTHFIFVPFAFVHLFACLACLYLLDNKRSLTMLHFESVDQLPLSYILSRRRVPKTTIALQLMSRYLRYFFFGRLLDNFFFDFLFGTHAFLTFVTLDDRTQFI